MGKKKKCKSSTPIPAQHYHRASQLVDQAIRRETTVDILKTNGQTPLTVYFCTIILTLFPFCILSWCPLPFHANKCPTVYEAPQHHFGLYRSSPFLATASPVEKETSVPEIRGSATSVWLQVHPLYIIGQTRG
jgi:hypothetical protein